MTGLMCVNFSAQAQADADAVHGFVAPVGMTLVGVGVWPEAFTGEPTGFNIDVNVGASAAVTALAANTAGTGGNWASKHLGGANAAVAIASGAEVTVDVNFAGGTTPAADYDVCLWLLPGTV